MKKLIPSPKLSKTQKIETDRFDRIMSEAVAFKARKLAVEEEESKTEYPDIDTYEEDLYRLKEFLLGFQDLAYQNYHDKIYRLRYVFDFYKEKCPYPSDDYFQQLDYLHGDLESILIHLCDYKAYVAFKIEEVSKKLEEVNGVITVG